VAIWYVLVYCVKKNLATLISTDGKNGQQTSHQKLGIARLDSIPGLVFFSVCLCFFSVFVSMSLTLLFQCLFLCLCLFSVRFYVYVSGSVFFSVSMSFPNAPSLAC
jgi:hypothetical protein